MKHPCPGLIATLNGTAPIASIDYETYYDAKCSIKELGAWAYCRHPDWEAYLITSRRAEFVGGAWLKHPTVICHPSEFVWANLHGHRIYSHNAGFDHTVYRREVELGNAPADFEAKIEGWDCTADFGAYHCNRRSLADVVLFMFGRVLDKSVRDDAKGKRWANFTAEEKAKMLAYGGTDADECLEIAIESQTKWPDTERLLSRMTRLQAMRGVQIDVPKLNLFLRAARDYRIQVMRDIPWVGTVNPRTKKPWAVTSTTAYCQYCRDNGIPPPPVKAQVGEDAYLEWEAEHADDNPVIKAVSTYRSVNKLVGQLETIIERLDEKGIFRFNLLYFGAHTGRFSGRAGGDDSGKKETGFNMQNILKSDSNDPAAIWIVTLGDMDGQIIHAAPINPKQDPEFAAFHAEVMANPDKKKRVIPHSFKLGERLFTLLDMRALFIPRPGKSFAIADSSQIEPRCLAFLTGDRAFIDLVNKGIDIYEAHARTMHGFAGAIGELKKLAEQKVQWAVTLRARSKAERLGLGYQAGPKGYVKAAALLAGLVLTFEEAKQAVLQYRAANPLVVRYWDKLQRALSGALGRTLRLRLPSGRIMAYRNVQMERKQFINPDTNKVEWRDQLTAETGKKRVGFYGGKLTENLCQSTAREVFCDFELSVWEAAYQRALAAGLKGWEATCTSLEEAPLWQVHDEMIVEFLSEKAKDGLAEIIRLMSIAPEWMGDTPFAAEGHVSDRYLK